MVATLPHFRAFRAEVHEVHNPPVEGVEGNAGPRQRRPKLILKLMTPRLRGGWVTKQMTRPAGRPMSAQGNLKESGDVIEIVPGDEEEWIPIPAVPKTVSYP